MALKIAFRDALCDLLFPVYCVTCDAPITRPTLPACTSCLRRMRRADMEEVRAQCRHLAGDDAQIASVFAMWDFTQGSTIQHLQHAMKYGNRPSYAMYLGRLMAAALHDALSGAALDAITPVPLHVTRLYERGYNQSRHLAAGIAERLRMDEPVELLRRVRNTRKQTALGLEARRLNVADAFVVRATEEVRGRRILLVDDVLTTGATVAAVSQALRAAEAASVHIATLAYARP